MQNDPSQITLSDLIKYLSLSFKRFVFPIYYSEMLYNYLKSKVFAILFPRLSIFIAGARCTKFRRDANPELAV